MVPGINYNAPANPQPIAAPTATVYYLASPLMRGQKVFDLQCRLHHLGYLENDQTDWVYGPVTAAAVKAFQVSQHLNPDGEAGPLTLKALGI